MGKSVQDVKIVSQRISKEDAIAMFEVMLDAAEALLTDPSLRVRFLRLGMLAAAMGDPAKLVDPAC